ncbi:putative Methyl-accepting chemotaxis protein [Vibrio nigripulchritudo SFn27]|uniref:CHASE3 domain-containing protein n=1 Tax=Vibrio nigripulchritudo TaxID=28173 RepID=UPI0003B23BB1|nr:CHASE3 domain-containing protein [Vibrio nigripulchritudo]CCN85615.1 putative Methyl-accepting chemotaxis protein [Vibrio nigripulchritudo BLFn1]CCN87502.1 putative Methyl-accepting chemotaxis protein [Vibrio nigripulchritudo SFn27]CCN94881.1 putative Methyl-accepting chemotaxis protein [Vibrio nigripulchritudo ENn2]CCO40579.1 putative Methyl-accepting chemotaxis protein [Vibrio nigripulchritudo SFn135]CCO54656.1 putative Methyl-accepting chemotaxis protein [Vibrio nigripulchritudo Wn13]
MFKNLPLSLKISLGTGIPLVLLIFLSVVALNSSKSQDESGYMVDHTHKVIRQAMMIEAAAVDMETGMRGFLLAGQQEFLEPYNNGRARFNELVSKLQNTVDDNPAQVQRLSEIQNNINDWLNNVTEPAIGLRREIGDAKTMDDMADLVGQARGKVYFDKFREQIATFIERENELLRSRRESTRQTSIEAYQTISDLETNNTWVNHTHEVIRLSLDLTGAAVDMETGMRGFLLAGKNTFLEPYNSGRERFFELSKALKEKVSDNPIQVSRIVAIEKNIQNWNKNITEPAIAERRRVNSGALTMDYIADLVGQARGKQYFDRFRGQIGQFISEEEKLIIERTNESKQSFEAMNVAINELNEASKWVEHTHKVIGQALDIQAAAVDMETGMRGYLLAGRPEFLEPYDQGFENFNRILDVQKKTVSDNPAQVQLLDEIKATISEWRQEVTEPAILLRSQIGDAKTMNDMAKLVGEARGKVYFDKFRGQIAEFINIEQNLMTQRQATADSAAQSTSFTIIVGTLIAVVIGAIVSWIVLRSIMQPVEKVAEGLSQLADGDLTVRISVDSNDELGKMSENFNQAVSKTNEAMAEVLVTTNQVAEGTVQIAKTSEQMAVDLDHQSEQVEHISTSIDEMMQSVAEVAKQSTDATNSAKEAGVTANSGGDIVRNTIHGMSSINEAVMASSKSVAELGKRGTEIGDIINVINDIAEQTNLLALNAAIEAARAGEAGRGFAVVADEVRTLADRTTTATEEIAQSIEAIQNETKLAVNRMDAGTTHVEEGVELAGRAGTSLEDIVAGAEAVASMIDSIAAASEEQANASAAVRESVVTVSEVSKNANSQASDAASSARELSSQTEKLKSLVSQFKVSA